MSIQKELSQLSITGRMLYCLTCLENALSHFYIEGSESVFIADVIKNFEDTDNLSDWEELAEDILPTNLLDSKFNITDFNSLQPNTILNIKRFYEDSPVDIVEIIDYTLQVGLNNLYGNTNDKSLVTLRPTLKVIELCLKNGITLPSISDYSYYIFDKNNGWG